MSGAMRGTVRRRADRILIGTSARSGTRPPVIVKQVSEGRSIEALRRVVRYIARLGVDYTQPRGERGQPGVQIEDLGIERAASAPREIGAATIEAAQQELEPPRLYDEDGNPVDRDQAVAHLRSWGLLPVARNESRRALDMRRRSGATAVALMTEEEAQAEVQGRHIVLSFPDRKPGDRRIFEQAVREMVKRTFGAWGFPALVATHFEHGRDMHAHVLVGTAKPGDYDVDSVERRLARAPETPRERFFFDSDGVIGDTLRETLAEVAGECGLDFDPSRREDRGDLIRSVLAGREKLRPGVRRRGWDEGPEIVELDDLPAMVRRIARRTPGFLAAEADGIAERFAEMETRRRAGRRVLPFPNTRRVEAAAREKPIAAGLIERIRALSGLGRSVDQAPEISDAVVGALRARRVFETEDGQDRTVEAVARWRMARREDARFADWLLQNAPYVYGPATAEAGVLDRDREFGALVEEMTAADREMGGTVDGGFARVARTEPATAAELVRRAAVAAAAALDARPGARGEARWALEGQKQIAFSYTRLAHVIEAAFPDEPEMLRRAAALRELADVVRAIRPIPTAGGEVSAINDLQRREATRRVEARESGGGREI